MAIKPSYITNIAQALLARYPEAFSTDFDQNKESVGQLTNIDSKEVQNRVAGYVTRKKAAPQASA
jgi:small subunit ribosomal protein S17e